MASRTIKRILKVNHGGEYGASRIYAGQIFAARFRCSDLIPDLEELRGHEIEHEARFRSLMPSRAARPCRLMWLWGLGGAGLGLMTGIVGRTGVLVCTEAVERTVHQHLSEQLEWLDGQDGELETAIAEIQTQEVGHLQWATGKRGTKSMFGGALDGMVTFTVEALIWLSTQGESARLAKELREGR